MKTIQIGGRTIGEGQPVFVIAEAGINHNGRLDLALEMIDIAKRSGADAVKFQTFNADRYISRYAPSAQYQSSATGEMNQRDLIRKYQLSDDDFIKLKARCDEIGIMFLSTPFDEVAADFLDSIGVLAFKIPSGEIDNLGYLQHVADKGKPIIMSTGMSSLGEVETAIDAICRVVPIPDFALLHCTSNYPARTEDANLKCIATLRHAFKSPTGYSDHTQNYMTAIAAVTLGACIVEKHFTLDTSMDGPDHQASLRPVDFDAYVRAIRIAEDMLGTGIKVALPSEYDTRAVARKSIVAARNIAAGERLTEDKIIMKRPGTGLNYASRKYVLGKTAIRDIQIDGIISLGDFV